MSAPRPGAPPAAVGAGVLLTTCAVLLLQVALTRLFSLTIWYHFAYVTIGMALLGYGAGGAMAALRPRSGGGGRGLWVPACAAALAVPATLAGAAWLPFRPFDLISDPRHQALPFTAMVLAIAPPFFLAGIALARALHAYAEHVGRLYLCDLLGAGLGAVLVVPCIWALGTPGTIALSGALLAASGVTFAWPLGGRGRAAALAATAAAGLAGAAAARLPFHPSPEKLMSRLIRDEGGTLVFSRWTPIYRTDVIEFPDADRSRRFGHASWGGSPRFRPSIPTPRARFIAHDGDACALAYEWDGRLEPLEMFRHHVMAAPYVLGERRRVLVIGAGGGADILNAIAHGVPAVEAIELDPVTVDLVGRRMAGFTGGLYDRPGVRVRAGEGRSILRREAGPYDVIQLTGVDTLAALSTGAYVLSESYLYTVEAVMDMRAKLAPGGVVSFVVADFDETHGVPRHTLRQMALFAEALARAGIPDPSRHVAVIASTEAIPQVAGLLSRDPLREDDISAIERFAREQGFEVWALPGRAAMLPPPRASVERVHSRFLRGSPADRERILGEQPLALHATTDDNPFFFHFYRWGDLPARLREIDTGHDLATGQILLAGMLGLSLLLGGLLVLLPLAWLGRQGLGVPGSGRLCLYFAGIGLGFILLEISLVQRLVLFLGYPTYALSVVLGALLLFAGIGSGLSSRVEARLGPGRPAVRGLLAALAALVAAWIAAAPWALDLLLPAPFALRVVVTAAALAPLGLVLGGFFPAGIRALCASGGQAFVPWAWGVNGVASVVGTVAAVMAAMSIGFRGVTLAALACYALAAWALPGERGR